MIEIVVVTYNSEAPARPLTARFAQAGGTIGRSDDNLFVLPDPKHHVSRRQAAISSDGVQHWITNLSQANPTVLNGVELASDVAHSLTPGDKICIGLYVLQARAVQPASAGASAGVGAGAGAGIHAGAAAARPSAPPAARPALPAHVPPRSTPSVPPNVRPLPQPPAVFAPAAPAAPAMPFRRPPAERPAAATGTAMTSNNGMTATATLVGDATEPPEAPALPADPQTLLQAFLDGAGIPSITLSSGLTPELMTMIGGLLAGAIDGTVDLIALRALVKREVNADVTMVVVRNNNPLKFLPDGATVLTQMLRKRMPGFMSPAEAMQDAYDDLHAHQLGMMAGMQATLADLHKQLDPIAIERSTAPGSAFERMLPSGRKARNWDRYCELHRASAATIGNATQSMARKAFLTAYERASEQYKDEAANER